MRILYVCSDFGISPDGVKGASIHLRSITNALRALGNQVELMCARSGGNEHPELQPILAQERTAVETTGQTLHRWLVDREMDPAPAAELRSLLFNASVFRNGLGALKSSPPDVIIERQSLMGHLGVDFARELGVPLLLEVNAPLTREASTYRSVHHASLAADVEARVLREADGVIAVSAQLKNELATNGVDSSKIEVVPNGFDTHAFSSIPTRHACRARHGLADGPTIGFAGSLKRWHGCDVLLQAFEAIAANDSDVQLLIVGTGPAEQELRETAEQLGLKDRVRFTGGVDHAEIPTLLGAMDIAVAPFRTVEKFYFSPIKLFEYMAAGRCIVASRLGQIGEVIDDGTTGFLCEPDDPQDLAAKLSTALQSQSLREQMGEKAKEIARDRYTWSQAARATESLARRLIKPRRPCLNASPDLAKPEALARAHA